MPASSAADLDGSIPQGEKRPKEDCISENALSISLRIPLYQAEKQTELVWSKARNIFRKGKSHLLYSGISGSGTLGHALEAHDGFPTGRLTMCGAKSMTIDDFKRQRQATIDLSVLGQGCAYRFPS